MFLCLLVMLGGCEAFDLIKGHHCTIKICMAYQLAIFETKAAHII